MTVSGNCIAKALIAFGLAQALLVGTAAAQEAKPAADAATNKRAVKLDANSDGAIDRTEMRAAREKLFEALDANRDGVVSREEFLASADARFARFDRNKDGRITREEAQPRQAQQPAPR